MSSIQTSVEHAAELRVDYKDLVAGQLVIVIHGLPTPGDNAVTPDAHKRRGVAARFEPERRPADLTRRR